MANGKPPRFYRVYIKLSDDTYPEEIQNIIPGQRTPDRIIEGLRTRGQWCCIDFDESINQ